MASSFPLMPATLARPPCDGKTRVLASGHYEGKRQMLPAPSFHHLHLNSTDPDAAIAFYIRQFPSTTAGTWAGLPALRSPNNVMVLFTKVDKQPPVEPPSAIWHFGWHVPDVRQNIETYQGRHDVRLLPLYTTDEG